MKSRAVAPAGGRTRSVFMVALFALVAVFGSAPLRAAESAASYYKHGITAEAREDYDAATIDYQKAYAAAPKDLRYKESYFRIRVIASAQHITRGRKMMESGDVQGALAEFIHAGELDPSNEAAQQEMARARRLQGQEPAVNDANQMIGAESQQTLDAMSSPVELKPLSNEPLTLHMSEDAKVVYQAVGKASGINILFDPEYTSKRIQVDLNSVSLLDALRILGTISGTFWRPVTANTLFVATNNKTKRGELDEQAVQTFYLTNAWQTNDLNDVQQTLRQVIPNAKMTTVGSQNAIVIRATPDELLLAQKLIADLDKPRPEVVVDIAVLEVSKNWERNLGLSWPSSAGVALQTSTTSSTTGTTSTTSTSTSTAPTIYDLAHLKASDFAVTIGTATANLLLTDSNTKILQNPRIRCTDAQKATMKIGERIPIATGSYSSGTSTTALAGMVNTQFQYIDVGVNIEMTPTVHFDHDVTLKIKIEDSSENGTETISGVTEPIIAQKTSEQVIRLREGEASVMSGILNRQEIESWSGVPGLSSIPGVKYLFGNKDHTITDDEIVFLIIPHIVRSQDISPTNLRPIDTGVGTSIDLRHTSAQETSQPTGQSPDSVPAKTPGRPNNHSQFGSVPGASVDAAAPAALAQMRAAADTAPSLPASQPAMEKIPVVTIPATPLPAATVPLSLSFRPPATPVAAGSAFQIPILLNGGVDVAAVPMQITYDPALLSLVNVAGGDLLSRDGQALAVVHRDEGPGTITLNVSRPPGAKGISGSGVVCLLSFQAKKPGAATLVITRPTALNSAQQPLAATGGRIQLQVK